MNETWTVEKQEVIKDICTRVCIDKSYVDDLAQWVSMFFLTTELEEHYLTEGFIYSVAYKGYHLRGSTFRREHIEFELLFVDLLSAQADEQSDRDTAHTDFMKTFVGHYEDLGYNKKSIDKMYEDVLEGLTPIEEVWAREIVKRNMSINMFSEQTGISRAKAKERMDYIYNKLRDNARD